MSEGFALCASRRFLLIALNRSHRSGDDSPEMGKTTRIPTWDEYFYKIARLVAQRSKDEKSPVGAVIVREEDRVLLSSGYNGPAREVLDLPSRLKNRKDKLPWVCHAEANAIYNAVRSGSRLEGGTISHTILKEAGITVHTPSLEFKLARPKRRRTPKRPSQKPHRLGNGRQPRTNGAANGRPRNGVRRLA